MKYIAVTTQRNGAFNPVAPYHYNSVLIASGAEKWQLKIQCQESGTPRDLEVTQLEFILPNGRKLTVTVQDLMALEKIATHGSVVVDGIWESRAAPSDVEDVQTELKYVQGLFS